MSQTRRSLVGGLPLNAYSAALRQAGLRVTSARMLTLRLAPSVLAEHGCLNPQLLHAAAQLHGYAYFSISAFYNTLPRLVAAGLLPADALPPAFCTGKNMASLPVATSHNE